MNSRNRLFAIFVLAAASGVAGADAPNLLPNGDFSNKNQLTGWTNLGPATMEFSKVDANGLNTSGSILLTTDTLGNPTYAVSSCFQVTPGAPYSYGAFVGVSKTSSQSIGEFTCSAYATTNCSGTHMELPAPVVSLNTLTSDSVLANNAQSADCEISVRSSSTSGTLRQANGYFDNLFFDSAAPASTGITLNGYMSGNWYDAAEGGQGFQLEFTDQNNAFLAIWFVYTPDGSGQNWIYAQGAYDETKNTATIPAVLLTGAKFPPSFNSADVHSTPWGSITFTFTDCNNGTATWHSTVTGYGSGSMPITRLTRISGTSCPQ